MPELKKAITIAENNIAIKRIDEKCTDCGVCSAICKKREGINNICEGKACVNCGQCIQLCPTGALIPKSDIYKLKQAFNQNKVCIAYTAPSVRVSIGESFGMERGEFVQGKLVSALRKIGFKYVFDVTCGADFTIVEEANELVDRIKNNGKLPMFTSCCPAWIKYAEQYYPEILDNISTCKSPIGMLAEIVQKYFLKKVNLKSDDIYTVAITPCTAKKYEMARAEIGGTDIVLTTTELAELLQEQNIDLKNLPDDEYDSILGEGSGAGMIFGNTGGVMEAALRTTYNILTGKELEEEKIEFEPVRGLENVKEAVVNINGLNINIAIVHQMSSAIPILEDVKNGTSKYHYIEIMNCFGGCIGGGGQPKTKPGDEKSVKQKRIDSLYKRDKIDKIRTSHKNPNLIEIYRNFLGEPLGVKAEELLHTKYEDKSSLIE